MKEWKVKKAENGKMYVHLNKRELTHKALLEGWGVRFDTDSDSKKSIQGL